MSLYSDYIKEREGSHVVEDDKGFATYKLLENEVYIVDVYVKPEFRQTKIASSYADKVTEIARSLGYKKLTGSVVPSAPGGTRNVKSMIAYGYEIEYCTVNFIKFCKEI